jgi:outer membrane protein OmpA-like peptidoglycan-associated protein
VQFGAGVIMKKFLSISSILILLAYTPASAVVLTWDIPKNERMEMIRNALVRCLINDKMQNIYEERNIIDLTCYDKKNRESCVRGTFSVYRRGSPDEVFRLEKQYRSDFSIDRLGRYRVPKKLFIPNLRHIPTFPDRDVSREDKWTADAELVLDAFSIPFTLVFPVQYRLADIRKKDGADIAVVNYDFVINTDFDATKYPKDFPLKILGKEEGVIYWDVARKMPVRMNEKYRVIFNFPAGDGKTVTEENQMYFDTRVGKYAPVSPKQKEQARKELKKEVPEGVDVDSDSRGLAIRLGDVLFDFDSSNLKSESRRKLDTIVEVLKKRYPDREIIVEGHADNIGEHQYNDRLSESRARTVAEYLKSKSVTDKLSYRGFGSGSPIADNATKEGRQKNRRVEIIIKLQ